MIMVILLSSPAPSSYGYGTPFRKKAEDPENQIEDENNFQKPENQDKQRRPHNPERAHTQRSSKDNK